MSNEHEVGRAYWLRDGREVEYLARTDDGKHVVAPVNELETYDGWDRARGPIEFASELFAKPPVEKRSEEIVALEVKVRELEKRKAELYSECINSERDVRARLDKLKKYQGLELLEDFIDGKITHFVLMTNEYGIDLKIETAEVIQKGGGSDSDRWDKTLKLVTLFGKSSGDLQWKVNRYYDGSGDWKSIWPCRSEEEAKQVIAAIYQKAVDDHFPTVTEDRSHWFLVAYEKAVSVGLEQRPEVAARYGELKQAALLKQEDAAKKELEEAQAKLADIQAKGAA